MGPLNTRSGGPDNRSARCVSPVGKTCSRTHGLAASGKLTHNVLMKGRSSDRGRRVSSIGAGFQVVVSGEALTAGIPGQSVRVRLGGGRVVTGTVRDGQTVEVRL